MSPMLSTAVVSDESHNLTDYASDLACVGAILYVYALNDRDLYGRFFVKTLREILHISSKCGTYETVRARSRPWLSGESRYCILSFSHFAQKR